MGPLSLLTIVRESVARHCKDIKMHSPAAKSPGTGTRNTRMPQTWDREPYTQREGVSIETKKKAAILPRMSYLGFLLTSKVVNTSKILTFLRNI